MNTSGQDAARLSFAIPDSVLVVEDIGHNPDVWRTVCSSQRVTVAFDLYYCGIAFFDPQRSRQLYIVNF